MNGKRPSEGRKGPEDPGWPASGICLLGGVTAIAMGLLFGVVRYWLGFLVLIQGVLGATAACWLLTRHVGVRTTLSQMTGPLSTLSFALMLTAAFLLGEVVGIGLAQPWFDPLGWFGRIVDGKSSEALFGIAFTGSVAHDVNGYIQGGFWILMNALDIFFLFFFFWIMPGIFSETGKAKDAGSAA